MGAPEPERPPGQSKARMARFEELNSQEYQKRNETHEIFIPVAERLGNKVIGSSNVSKVLRRPPADRQPELQPCRRAPSSASSAPTAPVNRRCSDDHRQEQPDPAK